MGLFDGLKIMKDVVSGGIEAAKASGKLEKMAAKAMDEYGDVLSDKEKALYKDYQKLAKEQDNTEDSDKLNEIIEKTEAAAVTFLTAVKQNKSLPKSIREDIPKVIEDYKKANNVALEKMEQRLLKVAETEEEKEAIRKGFEEEKTK